MKISQKFFSCTDLNILVEYTRQFCAIYVLACNSLPRIRGGSEWNAAKCSIYGFLQAFTHTTNLLFNFREITQKT